MVTVPNTHSYNCYFYITIVTHSLVTTSLLPCQSTLSEPLVSSFHTSSRRRNTPTFRVSLSDN